MKILTIDLEDWFHILDHSSVCDPKSWDAFESRVEAVTRQILDLLDFHNAKATIFVLGWIAERHPHLILELKNRGHEIACHSHFHRLVYTQSYKEFEADLIKATDCIERITGVRPTAYRAPGFSITADCDWAFSVLTDQGYTIDCSVFPANRAHGGMPSFKNSRPCKIVNKSGKILICFPINVRRVFAHNIVFSGGGYFRLFPKELLRKFFQKDDYVMTYFHPRDFDMDQPMMKDLSATRRFKSYVGISRSFSKLNMLLEEFDFITVKQAVNELRKSQLALPEIYL